MRRKRSRMKRTLTQVLFSFFLNRLCFFHELILARFKNSIKTLFGFEALRWVSSS